jgi:DNA-binding NarL/FixJ family response regulator
VTSRRLRVVLADDARLFRVALAELLDSNGCQTVAQVGDAHGLLTAVAATRPDLAVIDIRMPPTHGLEGLRAAIQLRRTQPEIGVLLLSSHLETTHLIELVGDVASGVGYLLKERVSGPDFIDAVQRVSGGGCAFDPEVVTAMLNGRRRRDLLGGLTTREHEVLGLMAQGMSNRAVAERLHLTAKTVETHVRNIFQRLALPVQSEHDRRVLAVLAYLRSD